MASSGYTSQKHSAFQNGPIGEKDITVLPGIGKAAAEKLEKKSFNKVRVHMPLPYFFYQLLYMKFSELYFFSSAAVEATWLTLYSAISGNGNMIACHVFRKW